MECGKPALRFVGHLQGANTTSDFTFALKLCLQTAAHLQIQHGSTLAFIWIPVCERQTIVNSIFTLFAASV